MSEAAAAALFLSSFSCSFPFPYQASLSRQNAYAPHAMWLWGAHQKPSRPTGNIPAVPWRAVRCGSPLRKSSDRNPTCSPPASKPAAEAGLPAAAPRSAFGAASPARPPGPVIWSAQIPSSLTWSYYYCCCRCCHCGCWYCCCCRVSTGGVLVYIFTAVTAPRPRRHTAAAAPWRHWHAAAVSGLDSSVVATETPQDLQSGAIPGSV